MGMVHQHMNKLSLIQNFLYDCDSSNGTMHRLNNATPDILHEKSNLIITLVREMLFKKPKLSTHRYYMINIKLSDLTPTEMQVLADCTDEIIEVLDKYNNKLNHNGVKSVDCKKFITQENIAKQHRFFQMQQNI